MAGRVVITGARGYVGGVLARLLAAEGRALRLVSRADDAPRNVAGTAVEHVAADLRREESWFGLMEGADAIVHLSSRTDLRAAEADPAGDEDMNIAPVRALARAAARRPDPPIVVFASTVTIYGVNPPLPVDESAPDLPASVYEKHKLVCENILREATRDGILRAATLRLANVYGFGIASINSNRGIVNAMMRRAIAGETLTLYGAGSYIRDFVHVDDVVAAFRAAIADPKVCDGSSYIIATGEGHSLASTYSMIASEAKNRLGQAPEVRSVPEPADLHPIERRNFIGNSALFRARADWAPRFGLRAGIADYFTRSLAVAGQT